MEGDSSFCGGWGRQAPGGAQSPQKEEKSSFGGGWVRQALSPRKKKNFPLFAGTERLPAPGAPSPRKKRNPPP